MTKTFRLSPSALNLFLECPRCFWKDKVRRIPRPRGIFPSLPGGMDRVIKAHFDGFRAKGEIPPELSQASLNGLRLFEDQARLNLWREWRTGLTVKDAAGNVLFGAIDDLLVQEGRYIPFDYKTKGSVTTEEDAKKYYQNQIDCYALMLAGNGMPLAGFGILLYYSPKRVESHGRAEFELQPIRLETDPERSRKTFRSAVSLLGGPEPRPGAGCEYCAWLQKNRI